MSSTNYSLYAIPALWGLSIAPHLYAASMTKGSNDMPDFQNVHPRDFLAKVRAQEKQTPLVLKYLRAEAAQQNSFEQIGFFGVSILAANYAKLPTKDLNLLAGLYLASRVLYTFLYIHTTKESIAALRSVAFLTGVGSCFTLLIKAGNALNRSVL